MKNGFGNHILLSSEPDEEQKKELISCLVNNATDSGFSSFAVWFAKEQCGWFSPANMEIPETNKNMEEFRIEAWKP